MLLFVQTAEEGDDVAGARREVRGVVARIDAARDGVHVGQPRVLLEEVGGSAGRSRDRVGLAEPLARRRPLDAGQPAVHEGRQDRDVLEHVLGHRVVGSDQADAVPLRRGREPAADDDVRLEMDDIGLDRAHDAFRVGLHPPREHEPQPRVRKPPPAVDAVHGEVLADVLLGEGADLAALGGSHDVHVVTARR